MKKIISFFLLSFIALNGNTATLTVCAGACDHTTIAAAVTAADPTDLIELREDRAEDVNLDKAIGGFTSDTGTRVWSSASTHCLLLENGIDGPVTISGIILDPSNNDYAIQYQANDDVWDLYVSECTIYGDGGTEAVRIQVSMSSGSHVYFFRNNFIGTNSPDEGFLVSLGNPIASIWIYNNIMRDFDEAIRALNDNTNDSFRVYNNTIEGNACGIAVGGTGDFENNLFINNTADLTLSGSASKAEFDYNAFETQTDTGGWGADNIFGVNSDNEVTDAANHIFTLIVGAQSVEAGATIAEVIDDYVGTSRPIGHFYDIGAYECTVCPGNGHIFRCEGYW